MVAAAGRTEPHHEAPPRRRRRPQPDATRLGGESRQRVGRHRRRAARGRDGALPAGAVFDRLRLRGRLPLGLRRRRRLGGAARGGAGDHRHGGVGRPADPLPQRPLQLRLRPRRRRDRRLRGEAVPARRRPPLRAALVQGLAAQDGRDARARRRPLAARRPRLRRRRRRHRLRDLRGRLGGDAARRAARPPRHRPDPQPLGEPLRLRQAGGARTFRARRLARLRRLLRLHQPARQRGRPGDLRRRRPDRLRRAVDGAWPPAVLRRPPADDGGGRPRPHPAAAGAAVEPPPSSRTCPATGCASHSSSPR
jgi:hypothetical protein